MTIITQSTSILCSDNPGVRMNEVRMCEGPLYTMKSMEVEMPFATITPADCQAWINNYRYLLE